MSATGRRHRVNPLIAGVVAGAGTYGIGRAGIVYFLEGVSLKDARRTYLASRKKRAQCHLPTVQRVESATPTPSA